MTCHDTKSGQRMMISKEARVATDTSRGTSRGTSSYSKDSTLVPIYTQKSRRMNLTAQESTDTVFNKH